MTVRIWLLTLCALVIALVVASPPPEPDPTLSGRIEAVANAPGSHGLFIHAGGETWYQPLMVYPAALLTTSGVQADRASTLPSLVAALIVVWLTFALAVRLPLSEPMAALAATLVIAMPGFIRHAGSPSGGMMLCAFVLAWCVAVLEHMSHQRSFVLLAGASALALSAYAHPAGVLAVPVFFVLGGIALWRAGAAWTALLSAAGMIALVLSPIAVWIAMHVTAYPDTLGRWAIHAAHVRNPVDGLVAFTRWHVAARRLSDYWNYFSPTFLFAPGHFFGLWPALLIPVGAWSVTPPPGWPMTRGAWLVLASPLAVPIGAVLLDGARDVSAVLALLPFGAVLAAAGVQYVLRVYAGTRIGPFGGASHATSHN